MTQVLVKAHDADEALTIAHELHRELPRPRVALQRHDSVFDSALRVTHSQPLL
jgi:hypothetical protein